MMRLTVVSVASILKRRWLFQKCFFCTTTAGFAESELPNTGHDLAAMSSFLQDKDLLCRSPGSSTGLLVLDLIDKGTLQPDVTLYSKLIRRCTQLGKVKEGKLVHLHFLNSGFRNNVTLCNSILNMYAKGGCIYEARNMFDKMSSRDMVTWSIMITAYSQSNSAEEALFLFPEMLRLGLEPNQFTFASLVKAAAARPVDTDGKQIHSSCFKLGYCGDVYVGSALVDMYARCGSMDEAILVFRDLSIKNEVSWNSLIAGYGRKSQGELGLKMFRDMQREDYKPTYFTYSSVFTACASTGSLEQGKWVHAHMIKSGGQLLAFVGNSLLDMYGKSGSIEDAQRVFNRLLSRDIVSWNSLITAFSQHGLGKEATTQFENLLRSGIRPNKISFLSVLTACSHCGLLDEGDRYFKLMKELDVVPDVSHYVTMVDLFGRAGLLDQAERFIKEMPIQPTAAIWGALLGACRMHKNMELGAYAAERVFELDPQDSGPHIILANIYAAAGRWKDVAKVRKLMKERGVKKEPACSWVEIENAVHMFVANDDAHPHREEVLQMWMKISEKIKEYGYVPDTSHVLLPEEDDQQREAKLQYHSEKLALAFALLNTAPGSTIRIKKNIRVCGDCHTAIKLVSKLVDREIIVRDKNRFHHFKRGECSCGDYW
uniref:DYW domain-containing protein n=1 Tax=Kalanchoe fedtschenkoi TaxID=63787 RepID=A0A7N0TTR2_KALFE